MNVDQWTGRWHVIEQGTWYRDPYRQHRSIETRVRAKGKALWMEQDIVLTDGQSLTWAFDGAFDGVMRPLTWLQDIPVDTHIAFSLFADNFGGDTFKTLDGKKTGCETWTLMEDRFEVRGFYTFADEPYPYAELWQRVG